jgi:mRNA interferase MazF
MIRGEIWWADFGLPFGSEAGFRRPVLIVQDDAFNESRIRTIVVLPLTTNLRLLDAPGNVLVNKKEAKMSEDSVILVAQLYALDRQKFIERISKVKRVTMEKVENGMMLVLGINKTRNCPLEAAASMPPQNGKSRKTRITRRSCYAERESRI